MAQINFASLSDKNQELRYLSAFHKGATPASNLIRKQGMLSAFDMIPTKGVFERGSASAFDLLRKKSAFDLGCASGFDSIRGDVGKFKRGSFSAFDTIRTLNI